LPTSAARAPQPPEVPLRLAGGPRAAGEPATPPARRPKKRKKHARIRTSDLRDRGRRAKTAGCHVKGAITRRAKVLDTSFTALAAQQLNKDVEPEGKAAVDGRSADLAHPQKGRRIGRDRGPNALNCCHSSPAGAVSIGPSGLDRRTGAVHSSVRKPRHRRLAAHRPSASSLPTSGEFWGRLARPPRPGWPDTLAGVGRSVHLDGLRRVRS
jgi:hypothetical protein